MSDERDYRLIAQYDVERIYTRLGAIETTQAVAAIEVQHLREAIHASSGAIEEIREKLNGGPGGISRRLDTVERDANDCAVRLSTHLRDVSERSSRWGSRLWGVAQPLLTSALGALLVILAIIALGILRVGP